MRMRHIVICGLSATTKMFPHYLIEGTILEKWLLNKKKKWVLFSLQISSETFLIPRRIEGDR